MVEAPLVLYQQRLVVLVHYQIDSSMHGTVQQNENSTHSRLDVLTSVEQINAYDNMRCVYCVALSSAHHANWVALVATPLFRTAQGSGLWKPNIGGYWKQAL